MLPRNYFTLEPMETVSTESWSVFLKPNEEERELLLSMGVDPDSVWVGHKKNRRYIIQRKNMDWLHIFLQSFHEE